MVVGVLVALFVVVAEKKKNKAHRSMESPKVVLSRGRLNCTKGGGAFLKSAFKKGLLKVREKKVSKGPSFKI